MKSGHKIRMENIGFDEDDIPLINQDEDYDDYKTPETSRVDETSFTMPDATEVTSTLRLRQKLKRDEIVSLYTYLDVTGDSGLADLERFNFKKIQKQAILNCFFSMLIINGNHLIINELVSF